MVRLVRRWTAQPLLMCTLAAQSRLPVCAGCLQPAVGGSPLASGLQMTPRFVAVSKRV